MKSILMTSSAAALVALSTGMAQAACPEDIDAFTRDYEEAMRGATGESLSSSEQAELFGLRTTAENLYRAGELEMCAQAIDRAQLMLDTAIAPTALQPSQLAGMEVRNAQDEYLGDVEDITIDPVSGRIAYLLIEHGGFLGIGDNLFAVPWRAVTWAPGAESLLLDITEEQLEQGPRFIEDQETAQERRAWLLSVHNYYGLEPYWQDNIGSMALAGGSGEQAAQAGAGGGAEAVLAVPVEVESVQGAGAEQSAAGAGQSTGGQTEQEIEAVPGAGQTQPAGVPAGQSDQGASADQLGGTEAAVVAVVPAQDAQGGQGPAGGDAMSRLMERLDQLEARLEEISGQNVGQEVRQSISSLQDQVRQLSESGPGEEVRQAIADLRDQMRQLAQQSPGEEVRAALSQLESQVQQIAQSRPGEEVRQAIAGLESRVQELAQSEPGTELRAMLARMESQLRQLTGQQQVGERAAAPESGAAMEATSGAGAESAVRQPARQDTMSAPAGGGQLRSDGTATGGQQQSGGTALAVQQRSAGAAIAGQPSDRDTAGGGQQRSDGAVEVIERQRPDGTTVYSTVPASPRSSGAGLPSAGGQNTLNDQGSIGDQNTAGSQRSTEGQNTQGSQNTTGGQNMLGAQGGSAAGGQAALGGQAGETETCEMGITRLEDDLARAQQEGVSIDGARRELEAAQAMLRRASEALCRAAIKRAREDLVSQGFQPRQAN